MSGRPRGITYKQGRARDVSPEEVMVYQTRIATVIRDAMLERDLSANEIYARAGVHPTSLSRVLTGKRTATILTLIRVARAMDMQPSELLP